MRILITVCILGLSAAGCAAARKGSMVRSSDPGAWSQRLEPLLEAHGLGAAARTPAGVRFLWRVESAAGTWTLDLGLRVGHDEVAWLREPGAAGPHVVDLTPRDLRIHDSALLGMALQSLPATFHLPWALTRGRWELRELLPPPERSESKALELVPLTARAGVGPFRLELDPATGLVRRVLYATQHRAAAGRPAVLALEGYAPASGIRWAGTRTTTVAEPRAPVDPRDLLLAGGPEAPDGPPRKALSETISAVRFLTEEEAEAELPLPGDAG